MPLLAGFQKAHAAQADRFRILGFHDATVRNLEDLDHRLKPIAKAMWNGEPLPYPILLDATGRTIRDYGIREYPTVVLLDPQGRVGKAGNEALVPDLMAELDRILAGDGTPSTP